MENQDRAMKLAMVNSVGEAAYDKEEVAKNFIKLLCKKNKKMFCSYYNLEYSESLFSLEDIANSRRLLLSEGKLDIDRAASLVLTDFRKGKTGRITLEDPQEITD